MLSSKNLCMVHYIHNLAIILKICFWIQVLSLNGYLLLKSKSLKSDDSKVRQADFS